ncbi:MAG: hypothetical protein B2I17_06705 [Thermoplasmatales archaeon B_DKE]|nr:MAG: hypothetical protein B2I17_06705 [Thermoplasmatales archaeon B_DKE]
MTPDVEGAFREIFAGEPGLIDELLSNENQYGKELSILLEEFFEYKKLKTEMAALQTRYAALNAEIYDLYMAVHSNAIIISATLAEHELMGNEPPDDMQEDAREILNEFLIFRGFR